MLRDPTDGSEIRHGRTLAQWLTELNAALKYRFRRNQNVERRVTRAASRQPLWDYWSSGYDPKDAATEM
jgi:hypothetical protein